MTTQEHLDRIAAKCHENLDFAARRTPGKWQGGYTSIWLAMPKRQEHLADCRQCDVAFIAACAGAAEAGWRATIAAIEGLDGMTPKVKSALESAIIAAWPEDLL